MTPLNGTEFSATAIKKVNWSHDAMIDFVLANPDLTQGEIAKHFGYTPAWISRVFCSDAFQARLAQRREDTINPVITASFEDRLKGLAATSVDILQAKLEASQSADLALKTLEISAKAAGYGARKENVNVQNNFVVALPPKVDNADAWAAANRPAQVVAEVIDMVPMLPQGA